MSQTEDNTNLLTLECKEQTKRKKDFVIFGITLTLYESPNTK